MSAGNAYGDLSDALGRIWCGTRRTALSLAQYHSAWKCLALAWRVMAATGEQAAKKTVDYNSPNSARLRSQ